MPTIPEGEEDAADDGDGKEGGGGDGGGRGAWGEAPEERGVGEEAIEAGGGGPPGEDLWGDDYLPGDDTKGDKGAVGFWARGRMTVFDVRITDTESPSYSGRDPAAILAEHERRKKRKYLRPCLERRRHFTPLVFSANGMMGEEAEAATKRLASLISRKWGRTYSATCGYVRARLSLNLARSFSLLVRGSRVKAPLRSAPAGDGAAAARLQWS